MNHCVPDFEIQMDEDEYPILPPISSTSGFSRPKKPSVAKDEIMELLWENGQVVMHSQNHRHLRKPPPPRNTDEVIPISTATGISSATEISPSQQARVENYHNHNHNQHDLSMQEDEMTSWFHYSIHEEPPPLDHNFSADIICDPPAVNCNQSHNSTMHAPLRTSHAPEFQQHQPSRPVVPRPPIPPTTRRPEQVLPKKIQNLANFSKPNARAEPSKTVARESTVVDSCDTPVVWTTAVAASRVSETKPTEGDNGRGSMSTAGVAAPWRTKSVGGGTGTTTFEMTVTSSPGGSSGSAEPAQRVAAQDRKRKCREPEESECQSEDVNFESEEAKKKVRRSKSTKRSRAAEVHNLSERRRRDRINEKMRALQELIPRCNKSDKASMLDEAIEYLKSLQLQVQMMSMGCGMVPVMFPGIQQYMPPMGMGFGMGMSMDMAMNRPVMPFPNMLAGSALPAATATAHLGPRFPMPPFHMPQVPAPDSSGMQAANQSDNMLTSLGAPDSDQSRIPNFSDPYQQYLGLHQMQLQLMQTMNQPNVSKPSTSGVHENPENHQSEEA